MSRLVTARPFALAATGTSDTYKERLERVAKYIPGEILATYLFLNGISATAVGHKERVVWFGVAFLICLVCTPLYFHFVADSGDPVRTQQVVSSIAFILWAYALGAGFFKEAGFYYPIPAAFGIAVFSLLSAWIVPKK